MVTTSIVTVTVTITATLFGFLYRKIYLTTNNHFIVILYGL